MVYLDLRKMERRENKAGSPANVVEVSSSSQTSSPGRAQELGEEATSSLRRSASRIFSTDHVHKRPRLQTVGLAPSNLAHLNTTAGIFAEECSKYDGLEGGNFAEECSNYDGLEGGSFHGDCNIVADERHQCDALEGENTHIDVSYEDVVNNGHDLPDDFLEPLDSPLAASPPPGMHLASEEPHLSKDMVKAMFRQFWKAGDYDTATSSRDVDVAVGVEHIRVHPKFLHSNATSHKWALGAIAELLDNSVDEAVNGATFVSVDMKHNPRDGRPMLIIEDDGGGMDPDRLRQCMSLGYSAKSKVANTIGQYGNGFKTSSMRLGADVLVFSRSKGIGGALPTQSIGLLSYTFLMGTGQDDVVVPMVDYQIQPFGLKKLVKGTLDDWNMNFDALLQWSPYETEQGLLDQLHCIKGQGTIVIVYNLWENDEGELELDFDADPNDMQLRGTNRDDKSMSMASKYPHCYHFFTHKYSLRSYASILYLRLPKNFRIILRGKQVIHHKLVSDLMLVEQVKYKPVKVAVPSHKDAVANVTLGFVKHAKEHIDVQGFNVYHKNRLIKPYWQVWNYSGVQGRGIFGFLEANFVEPAHDKQGFERTMVFTRLEARLIEIQKRYWSKNCKAIGYVGSSSKKTVPSKADIASVSRLVEKPSNASTTSNVLVKDMPISPSSTQTTKHIGLVVLDKDQVKSAEHPFSSMGSKKLPYQHTTEICSTEGASEVLSRKNDSESQIVNVTLEDPKEAVKSISCGIAQAKDQLKSAEHPFQSMGREKLPYQHTTEICSTEGASEILSRNQNDSESQIVNVTLEDPKEAVKSISCGIAQAEMDVDEIADMACAATEFDSSNGRQRTMENTLEKVDLTSSTTLNNLECLKSKLSDGSQVNDDGSRFDQPPGSLSAGTQLVLDVSGPSGQTSLMTESLQDSNEALISPPSQCDIPELTQIMSRHVVTPPGRDLVTPSGRDAVTPPGRSHTLTRSMLQLRQSHAKAARLESATSQKSQDLMASSMAIVSCLANTLEDGPPSITTLAMPVAEHTISLKSLDELEIKLDIVKQRLSNLQSDVNEVCREREFLKEELEEERRQQSIVEGELKKRLQALTSKATELEAANELMQACQR